MGYLVTVYSDIDTRKCIIHKKVYSSLNQIANAFDTSSVSLAKKLKEKENGTLLNKKKLNRIDRIVYNMELQELPIEHCHILTRTDRRFNSLDKYILEEVNNEYRELYFKYF